MAFAEVKELLILLSNIIPRYADAACICGCSIYESEILLVDEILAVGDEGFQKNVLDKMNEFKKNGTTIVYVSHAMNTVAEFCEKSDLLRTWKVKYDGEAKEGVSLTGKILFKLK